MSQEKTPIWSHRWTFILAATGSAVGLGNIWKFPYITGENGGGAFVLVYLACILIIGIPAMMAETLLGRAARKNPVHGTFRLAKDSDKSGAWGLLGLMGLIAGLMILSFYSPVAGWALEYTYASATGAFNNSDANSIGEHFGNFLNNKQQLTIMHSGFMLVVLLIIGFGVIRGLGKAINILMPILFLLLAILLGYSVTQGDFAGGLKFLFSPDFSKLTGEAILVALGHAFFTLSLGMGAIMTYGAYMTDDASIAKTTFSIAAIDTLVALMAGLAIFPLVFANSLDPSGGPGLLFVSLPIAFAQMPMGDIFGTLFFILVSIAALSSAISLLEPGVAWLERLGLNRWLGVLLLAGIAWTGGMACIYSNNWTAPDGSPFKAFEWLDHIASNILLPLGGLLICIFAGWKIRRKIARTQLKQLSENQFNLWYAFTRVIAPLCIIIVFVQSSGLLKQLKKLFA